MRGLLRAGACSLALGWAAVMGIGSQAAEADAALPSSEQRPSQPPDYMASLTAKYFDASTRKMLPSGLDALMIAVGVQEPVCGGHGVEVDGLCQCNDGYELSVVGVDLTCAPVAAATAASSSSDVAPKEEEHEDEDHEGHDHRRRRGRQVVTAPGCVNTGASLFEQLGLDVEGGASERQFKDSIAPALLSMIESKACVVAAEPEETAVAESAPATTTAAADVEDDHEGHDHDVAKADPFQSRGDAYAGALLAVTIISLTSVAGVLVLPLLLRFKRAAKFILMALVGIAIGVLVGDSIMHLLPAVYGVHSHGVEEDLDLWDLFWRTMCVVVGIYFLYFVETLLEVVGLGHAHSHSVRLLEGPTETECIHYNPMYHHHHHDPADGCNAAVVAIDNEPSVAFDIADAPLALATQQPSKMSNNGMVPGASPTSVDSDSTPDSEAKPKNGIRPFQGWRNVDNVVWLVVIGDGLHNFVDGISIGASFLLSQDMGIATSVAVLLHELPQELGDFGILVSAGTGSLRAIVLNGLSMIPAFLGVIVGIEAGTEANNWILAFSAGMFLYIALGSMLPQLSGDGLFAKSHPRLSRLVQHAAFIVGWMCMMAISLDEIAGHADHDH